MQKTNTAVEEIRNIMGKLTAKYYMEKGVIENRTNIWYSALLFCILRTFQNGSSGILPPHRKELIMAEYKRYSYGCNRKHIEDEFSEMAEVCREAEMPEPKIEAIHRLLLDQLNGDWQYYTHTFSYDGLKLSDGDESGMDNNPLMKACLDRFTTMPVEISDWGRNTWIEDLDSDEIIAWARTLDETDFQLITLLTVDGLKLTEIAKLWGVTVPAISKRKKRLAKKLAQILPEWLKRRYTN